MKADELGQRTSFLLLPPKERIREVWRRELALVDNFANAIRTATLRHMRSRWRLCSIPSCGRVSCGRSSISTHC
jgi:hypothetical protein